MIYDIIYMICTYMTLNDIYIGLYVLACCECKMSDLDRRSMMIYAFMSCYEPLSALKESLEKRCGAVCACYA